MWQFFVSFNFRRCARATKIKQCENLTDEYLYIYGSLVKCLRYYFSNLLWDAWSSTSTSYQKASHNGDAKGKTKDYYLANNYATRVSVSTWRQSQQCGQNVRGPFLRSVLLITVEVSTQAMAAYPKQYTWTMQIALLLSFFEKWKGLPPLAPPFLPHVPWAMTELYPVWIIGIIISFLRVQIDVNYHFFSEMGGVWINRVNKITGTTNKSNLTGFLESCHVRLWFHNAGI